MKWLSELSAIAKAVVAFFSVSLIELAAILNTAATTHQAPHWTWFGYLVAANTAGALLVWAVPNKPSVSMPVTLIPSVFTSAPPEPSPAAPDVAVTTVTPVVPNTTTSGSDTTTAPAIVTT